MKNALTKIGVLLFGGIVVIILLYISSDMLVHKSNNFFRSLPPHPVSPNYALDLKFNSYYLAGMEDDNLLLANSTSPLNMLKIDLKTRDTFHLRISIEKSPDIRLRKSTRVAILPPYFFL